MAKKVAADFVEVFGVPADGPDEAKRAALQWLLDRGYAVRSVNVAANEERTLVAYVVAGSVQAVKNLSRVAAS